MRGGNHEKADASKSLSEASGLPKTQPFECTDTPQGIRPSFGKTIQRGVEWCRRSGSNRHGVAPGGF